MNNSNLSELSYYLQSASALALGPLLINLLVGLVLALVISWHFQRLGSTLTNRREFSKIFPMLVMTIIMIISVVKSSLALALGLVGALSIVRFRTPIKEPEELAYLFLCIGCGLALGAGQTFAAIVATLGILAGLSVIRLHKNKKTESGLFMALDWANTNGSDNQSWLKKLNPILLQYAKHCDLRRFDDRNNHVEALYYLDILDTDRLGELTDTLKREFSGIGISFLDQKNVSGF